MSESTKKAPSKEPTIQEAEYTVEELAAASETVIGKGTMPECVIAAFRVAGVEKATKTEAKKIVTKYLTKEVK
jgi:phage-related baseplate assembly protein